MNASDSEGEVDAATWAAWSAQLSPHRRSPPSGERAPGGSARPDVAAFKAPATAKLYELAIELRDRLRFSQQRSRQLRRELGDARLQAADEREQCVKALSALEREASRLASLVQNQNQALDRRDEDAADLRATVGALQGKVTGLSRQLEESHSLLDEAQRTIDRLRMSRDEAVSELTDLRATADDSAARVQHHAKKHMEIMDQLLNAKNRVGQLASVEGLYVSARDELQRLNTENSELKEMLNDGVVELGRSRILASLASPHHHVASSPCRVAHPKVKSYRSRSPTKASTMRAIQSGANALGLLVASPRHDRLRSLSPGRRGGGVVLAGQAAGRSPGGGTRLLTPRAWDDMEPAQGRPRSPGIQDEDVEDAGEMAFLGPPTHLYPPDPDNMLYGRTGGGFVARAKSPSPSKYAAAKPSGWVPKDVVRLVQAFRHTYSIELEWRLWEPLLLMVDEVYRQRAAMRVGRLKTVQRERLKTMRRSLSAGMSYPSVLQSNKLTAVKKQLAALRGTLAREEFRENGVLRAMAEKGFHVGHSLDRAVEENMSLRHSLHHLDDMYRREYTAQPHIHDSITTTTYSPTTKYRTAGPPGGDGDGHRANDDGQPYRRRDDGGGSSASGERDDARSSTSNNSGGGGSSVSGGTAARWRSRQQQLQPHQPPGSRRQSAALVDSSNATRVYDAYQHSEGGEGDQGDARTMNKGARDGADAVSRTPFSGGVGKGGGGEGGGTGANGRTHVRQERYGGSSAAPLAGSSSDGFVTPRSYQP